jgi:ABC-type multidrug transport system fused ATPase/permease subunit
VFMIAVVLLTALITAVVYGVGGTLVIRGALQFGTLVALAQLLTRVYGPISSLSSVQIQVMTALVSFDRVFEVLDLEPLITEKPDAATLPARDAAGTAPAISFDRVSFRYPTAAEVSLASLESIALKQPERTDVAAGVLHEISFTAPAGELTALVGPSGAGKTTITQLVSRMYDPNDGAVLIGGHDIRDVTLESLHDVVGVVTQDAHLFHDTIRTNLLYARPTATEAEVVEACRAAQIWDLISVLPDGLDTIVGARTPAAQGAVHRGPRRGDRAPRLRVRVRRPAGPVARADRPDVARHRAPAVHRPRGQPDPRHRGRPGGRDRHPRRAPRRGRPVLRPLRDAVQAPGKPRSNSGCGTVPGSALAAR